MRTPRPGWIFLAFLLAACGGGSSGGITASANPANTPGTLVFNPPLQAVSLTAAAFQSSLDSTPAGQQLHLLASGPSAPGASTPAPLHCGVDVYKLQFRTTGGAGEATTSSGALMVPNGGTGCSGPRPIVLYGHGTATSQAFDLSNLADPTNAANGESALIAAVYASNGFIVVAPNYAGYDTSTLGYHPFLNAAQQSGEMIDALAAGRTALAGLAGTGDAGALFVSGYSAGGHTAMATVRALEAAGQPVAAAATMSGPYTMAAFGDLIFLGNVDIGATLFVPLIYNSYRHAYGNTLSIPTDFFAAPFNNAASVLPSALTQAQIFMGGLLPQTALFNNNPMGAFAGLLQNPAAASNGDFGFGTPFLVTDTARAAYLADAAAYPDGAVPTVTTGAPSGSATNGIRQALVLNDLRLPAVSGAPGWLPKAPMLLCAGGNDPVVFSTNTLIMQRYFAAIQAALQPAVAPLRHFLNIDLNTSGTGKLPASPDSDPVFSAYQQAFTGLYNQQAGTTVATQTAALTGYHTSVAPFCTAASLSFFASPR